MKIGLVLILLIGLSCSSKKKAEPEFRPIDVKYKFELSNNQKSLNLLRIVDGKQDNVRFFYLPNVSSSVRSWNVIAQCEDRAAVCAEDFCENLFIVNGSENRMFLMPVPDRYVVKPTTGWDTSTAHFSRDCEYFECEMTGYDVIRTKVDND